MNMNKNRLSAVDLNIEVDFAHMHSQEKCIWVIWNLSPDLVWNADSFASQCHNAGSGVKLKKLL